MVTNEHWSALITNRWSKLPVERQQFNRNSNTASHKSQTVHCTLPTFENIKNCPFREARLSLFLLI